MHILTKLAAPMDKLLICKGSSFQRSDEYLRMRDFNCAGKVTVNMLFQAGETVVKKNLNGKSNKSNEIQSLTMAKLNYPLMQCLDEKFIPFKSGILGADVQFGGLDQRKIFALSKDHVQTWAGYKCKHFMNIMIPGLNCKNENKMSCSDPNSKINFTDDLKELKTKFKKSFAEPGSVIDNASISILQHIIWPILSTISPNVPINFTMLVNEKEVEYSTVEEVINDYSKKIIFPLDLKMAVAKYTNTLLRFLE